MNGVLMKSKCSTRDLNELPSNSPSSMILCYLGNRSCLSDLFISLNLDLMDTENKYGMNFKALPSISVTSPQLWINSWLLRTVWVFNNTQLFSNNIHLIRVELYLWNWFLLQKTTEIKWSCKWYCYPLLNTYMGIVKQRVCKVHNK